MSTRTSARWTALAGMVAVLAISMAGCGSGSSGLSGYRNDLSKMQTAQVRVKDKPFNVWLALSPAEQERGLMQITKDQLGPSDSGERGMLFVFSGEQNLSFWMYNTITPLDIAYVNSGGRIVKTYTMAPLETRTYPSVEPAQYALEAMAGAFDRLGIAPGDPVEIPDSVLKAAP